MQYGEDKIRTMARSILPATNRRDAKNTAQMIKRRNRRNTRQTLHEWKSYTDPLEFEGHIFDYGEPTSLGWEMSSIKAAMWDRRQHDKLQPMIRWAKAYTAHLDDPFDRYMLMKKILPDNLIGRHALSHLEFEDEFDYRDEWNRYLHRGPWKVRVLDGDKFLELIKIELKEINRQVRRHNESLLDYEKKRKTLILPLCRGIDDAKFIESVKYFVRHHSIYEIEIFERAVEIQFIDR